MKSRKMEKSGLLRKPKERKEKKIIFSANKRCKNFG